MPEPAPIASANQLVVRFGGQPVLDRASLTIVEGERLGLVGRNGCGKSTFLQVAAGVLAPDEGEWTRRRDLITGYMPQMFELDQTSTVEANVLEGARTILDWIAEYENAPAESARSAQLLDRINHFDGWNLDTRARSLITNLHAPAPDRPVAQLSGGERRRVALCRALISRPDFLILDEPTNHLDTDSIEWLESFLGRYLGTCLFVTHDRYFLDRIATRIVELSRGQFRSYEGNYTDYLLARAGREVVEELQERKRQKFLKSELAWVRKAPRARRTKSVDRVERYFEMAGAAAPEPELDVEMVIPPAPKLANRVLTLRAVGVDLAGRTLFDNLSLDLAAGERLGIVGRNGAGKTTLLRLMLGEIAPTRGEVELGARTQINYVDQNRLLLDDDKSVLEEVSDGSDFLKVGEETISVRAYLRRFLFTDERINTRIAQLSGGERSRVLLAKILKRGGNLLIFDEPTNDLDLGTLRLLEEALVAFQGSIIVVSHDRYFLNRICTAILAFEAEGAVRYHVGNYDYYLEKRGSAPAAQPADSTPGDGSARKAAGSAAVKPPKLKWKEERELEGIGAAIHAAEAEVARLESLFATSDFSAQPAAEWQAATLELAAAREQVTQLYARWEELESIKSR